MKWPDARAILGSGLWMPHKYARAIPQLEAFEMLLALREQRMRLCNRLVISEAGEFLDGFNMAVAHEIAPHER